jgi:ketosteroid isomerase-like protein
MSDDEASVAAPAAIREHIDAFNEGDIERLLAGFSEDALWVTGQTVVRGRDELSRFFAAAIERLRPHLALENLITADGRAACQMTETLLSQKTQRSYSIAAFFRLNNGLITSAKIYREGSAEVA